jgi:alpha-mannosidase
MTSKRRAHVISHTHWDREWYLSFEQHRLRLVRLIDRLLSVLDEDERFRHFHFDGQTIMIDDYLAVRPHEEARLRRHIEAGRILIGPWYILQDGFLVTGESHVRNMLIGMEMSREYGSPMMVGYFPDTFGNFSQAPQLLRGFGIDVAAFGRGVGNMLAAGTPGEKDETQVAMPSEVMWRSPDGSEVLGLRFANWYNNADGIPADPVAGVERVRDIAEHAGAHTDSLHLLFMNGCDHTPVQSDIGDVIETLNGVLDDTELVHSTMPEFAAAIRAEGMPETVLTGELRDWDSNGWNTLDGTLSARMYLKQWNYRCERLLVGGIETLGVFAHLVGGTYDRDVWRLAWKRLMENHPHDSICGCSIDAVHRDMVARFEQVTEIAEGQIGVYLDELADAVDTTALGEDDRAVVVANTNGVPVRQLVSVVVDFPVGTVVGDVRVTDADGNTVAAEFDRLGKQPRYRLPEDRFREVYEVEAVEVQFIADVPSLGWHTYTVSATQDERVVNSADMMGTATAFENAVLRVEIGDDGRFLLTHKRTGHRYHDLNAYENMLDVGDEYRYKEPEHQVRSTTEHVSADVSLLEASALRHVVEIRHTMDIPAGSGADTSVEMSIATRLVLDADAEHLAVEIDIDNPVPSHRVRALFPTDLDTDTVQSSAPFDIMTRPITPSDRWENPAYTQPNDGWISVVDEQAGLTVATRGLPEFEVYRDGRNTVGLTLLRGAGEIGDWFPFPTPEAQCIGRHTAQYALIPHGGKADGIGSHVLATVQAYRNQLWVKMTEPGDGVVEQRVSVVGIDNEAIVVSACKLAQDRDEVVLRMWNATHEPASVRLATDVMLERASRLRLDESVMPGMDAPAGNTVAVDLKQREIGTVGLSLRRYRRG